MESSPTVSVVTVSHQPVQKSIASFFAQKGASANQITPDSVSSAKAASLSVLTSKEVTDPCNSKEISKNITKKSTKIPAVETKSIFVDSAAVHVKTDKTYFPGAFFFHRYISTHIAYL
jgi:hypothetical protein